MNDAEELDELRQFLPEATAEAWEKLAPVVPQWAYLAGETALTVHLHHRVSRDLDFFTEREFPVAAVLDPVEIVGRFAVSRAEPGTVNGTFEGAKVQFLDASSQRILEPLTPWAGLRISSVADLMAMKLKVVRDRGELRDYFDLMAIEQQTDLRTEEGMRLVVERYAPRGPEALIAETVRALGYLDDVEDDPSLPVSRKDITSYWVSRQKPLLSWLAHTLR
ncbi:nucleotidyl transferase AbiEii/AbiGii toxin family protein [Agrococcus sp. KRD186]|uniref:nucleotidyl transferase AbiEii/AbiGii toxin family protein n=1 Tax=Agrococcus sp. KRD186 TaxID=2729730 RepID=UPI0019CFCCB3|nr:nucleotidyl transferase AbiEii/AbiGii toxin family protein [Agrococcus sp. KRD186]